MQYYASMQSLVTIHKALADKTRWRLFRLLVLAGRFVCECELVDALRKPQYTVSRASSVLRAAGLAEESRRGKLVFLRAGDTPVVQQLGAWVISASSQPDPGSAGKNPDGSQPPGRADWFYDWERLRWRFVLRDREQIQVTYPNQEGRDDPRRKVLLICVHNSARSQMAEEYFRSLGGDLFLPVSAGLTPGNLNPYVVQAMKEDGIDISKKPTRAVADIYRRGYTYDYVITVCSREAELGCPVFPGPVRRLNWPFPDPAGFTGTETQILNRVRELRDAIKERISRFVEEIRQGHEDVPRD